MAVDACRCSSAPQEPAARFAGPGARRGSPLRPPWAWRLPPSPPAQGPRRLRHPGLAKVRALSHPGTPQPRRQVAPHMATGCVGARAACSAPPSARLAQPAAWPAFLSSPLLSSPQLSPALPSSAPLCSALPSSPPHLAPSPPEDTGDATRQPRRGSPAPWPFLRHASPRHPPTPGPDRDTREAGSPTQTHGHPGKHRDRHRRRDLWTDGQERRAGETDSPTRGPPQTLHPHPQPPGQTR